MRELAVAIVVSALVVGGVLLLPYSISKSPSPQTVATQQVPPQTARPPAEAVQPAAAPVRQHAQSAVQPLAGAGGDREQGRQVYRKCQACLPLA
jgi:hypothetical protein